jgi:hypothetical protein
METGMIYQPDCQYAHKELNEHGYEHKEISKEGQEDQVQHRGRYSMDHSGNVRMIENATT